MRILELCGTGSLRYGASVSFATVCEGLKESGHEVTAGYLDGRPLGQEMRSRGFSTLDVPIRRKIDARGIGQLVRLLRAGRFEAMQVHMSTACINGGLAGRLAKVPTATTVHGTSNLWSYRWGHHIIAVSEFVRQHLIKQGANSDRVTTVHNGIVVPTNNRRIPKHMVRNQYNLPGDAYILGITSRLVWAKGYRTLLNAMPALVERIPQVVVWVLGDGADFEAIKAEFEPWQAQGYVRFEGFQPVYPALYAMDAFLLPTESEALGMSILEAMAAELPVVATTVGGVPEVVDGDTGVLFQKGDARALAQAVANVSEIGESLGRAGRRRVLEKFTHLHMAQRTANALQTIRLR